MAAARPSVLSMRTKGRSNAAATQKRIGDLGSMQEWASVYPLFHWGPIPWSFYIVLAIADKLMIANIKIEIIQNSFAIIIFYCYIF